MNITFSDKKLLKIANDYKKCQKELGANMAKTFMLRLEALSQANTLEDVRYLPGRFHELVENRKGDWACDLGQPYRLIFTPHERPIPTDPDGKYIWIEIKGVEIKEIENYHGK